MLYAKTLQLATITRVSKNHENLINQKSHFFTVYCSIEAIVVYVFSQTLEQIYVNLVVKGTNSSKFYILPNRLADNNGSISLKTCYTSSLERSPCCSISGYSVQPAVT